MRYREIKPGPRLARFVECFWTLEDDENAPVGPPERDKLGPPAEVPPERILPDGCVELILNFGARFREHRDDKRDERQPRHFLVGQMTRPMMITADGRVELIGVRFHPGGTLPFFKNPMDEFTNQVVELAALSSDLERSLVPRVGEASSLKQKVTVLEHLLADRIRTGKHDLQLASSHLANLAAKIVHRGGQVTIDELAIDAGISGRQLERRFLRDIGVGPKLLCRILRFQQVFRAVEGNGAGWAGLAVDCGYYDQAHLIRDFQQFAGQTPSILFAQSSPLTEVFTRKQRMSDFSNTVA